MVAWTWQKSTWVAVASSLFLLASISISVLTLVREDLSRHLRYVSYSGGGYPENGIFNLLLYFSAIFGSILMIMRYVDIDTRTLYSSDIVDHINKISVFFGMCSMVGMVVIASYPTSSDKEVNLANEAGTYTLIICGTIYCGIQTVLSFYFMKCSPCFITRLMILAVTFVAVIATPTLLMHVAEESSVVTTVSGNETNGNEYLFYTPEVRSPNVIASAVCLRISLLAFSIFQLSFLCEFKKISGYVIIRAYAAQASELNQEGSWVRARKSWHVSERF